MIFIFSRDITVYSWENIWEEGNGDKAYKLANAGYKVMVTRFTSWLLLATRLGQTRLTNRLMMATR